MTWVTNIRAGCKWQDWAGIPKRKPGLTTGRIPPGAGPTRLSPQTTSDNKASVDWHMGGRQTLTSESKLGPNGRRARLDGRIGDPPLGGKKAHTITQDSNITPGQNYAECHASPSDRQIWGVKASGQEKSFRPEAQSNSTPGNYKPK